VPSYDYKCDSCGYTEEVSHGFTEDWNGESCWTEDDHNNWSCCGEDNCNEERCSGSMYRLFQATPAIFRGLGWGKMTTYKPKKNS